MVPLQDLGFWPKEVREYMAFEALAPFFPRREIFREYPVKDRDTSFF